MKPGLHPGATGELTWTVDPTMTITLGHPPAVTVFSTPNLVLLLERAAREALRPFLEPDEESVGIEVQVEHTGPAALGEDVRAEAKVTECDGRKVAFTVRATAGGREVGRGTHRRAVVTTAKLAENLRRATGAPAPAMPPAAPPTPERVRFSVAGGIATATFHRPAALNAVDSGMTAEWEQIVAWLAAHPEAARVLVITGAGDAFCAGDDLKELPALGEDEARQLSLRQARLWLALEQLPQPVIGAINGAALGAGCVAAVACDFRLAAHGASFGMPEIRVGWPPGYGLAQLVGLVGKARALELCLTGEPIAATRAQEWGLVQEVVPAARLLPRARELAGRLLAQPAEALRATKRLLHATEGALPRLTHRAETEAYVRCLFQPDAREGLAAFAAHRRPKFEGR